MLVAEGIQIIHHIIVPGIFILLSLSGQSQGTQKVCFSYDDNGNRVTRSKCSLKVAEVDSTDTTSTIADSAGLLQNLAFMKVTPAVPTESENGRARLYPNPTPGALELSIPWADGLTQVVYGCYSPAGAELFRGKTTTVITKIDISRYPPGSYVIVLFLKKRDVVWKVVRYYFSHFRFHILISLFF